MLITNPKKDLLQITSNNKQHNIKIKEQSDGTFNILNDDSPIGSGSGLPEVEGSGKSLVSINSEWKEQSGYGFDTGEKKRNYLIKDLSLSPVVSRDMWQLQQDIIVYDFFNSCNIYAITLDGISYYDVEMISSTKKLRFDCGRREIRFNNIGNNNLCAFIANDSNYSQVAPGQHHLKIEIVEYGDCNTQVIIDNDITVTRSITYDVPNCISSEKYDTLEEGKEYSIGIDDKVYASVFQVDGDYTWFSIFTDVTFDLGYQIAFVTDDTGDIYVAFSCFSVDNYVPQRITIKDNDDILYSSNTFSWQSFLQLPANFLSNIYLSIDKNKTYKVLLDNVLYTANVYTIADGETGFINILTDATDISTCPTFCICGVPYRTDDYIVETGIFCQNLLSNYHTISIYEESDNIASFDPKLFNGSIGQTLPGSEKELLNEEITFAGCRPLYMGFQFNNPTIDTNTLVNKLGHSFTAKIIYDKTGSFAELSGTLIFDSNSDEWFDFLISNYQCETICDIYCQDNALYIEIYCKDIFKDALIEEGDTLTFTITDNDTSDVLLNGSIEIIRGEN